MPIEPLPEAPQGVVGDSTDHQLPAPVVRRIRVGEIPVDAVDLTTALEVVESLVRAGRGGTVFTPNVDHIVVGNSNARFRAAYQGASV